MFNELFEVMQVNVADSPGFKSWSPAWRYKTCHKQRQQKETLPLSGWQWKHVVLPFNKNQEFAAQPFLAICQSACQMLT